MTTVSIAKQPVNLDALLDKVTRTQKPVKIRTPKSTYILLSDEEWRGIQEKLYLQSIPGVWESIVEGMKAPREEFCSLEDIGWTIK